MDQTVLSISRTYDSLGRAEFITSHSDADPDLSSSFADAVNQVQYTYTAFGALDKEYQEHEGKVDGSSLHVDYAYDDTADTYNGITSVFTKGMRPKSVKYPDGRLVHYTYGTGGGLDDLLSRVAAIYNDDGGSPGTTAYAAYKRAGDGRIVEEAFAEPDLKLTYIGAGTGTRDYSGFDRFGRVVWQRWLKTNGSAADRYFYGYDRNSNRRWRAERSNASSAAGQRDEAYAYDRLNRLVGAKRGILPSGTYQAPYPGDVTGNGVVDGSDSSVITANLGNSSRRWASGDLNGDGLVNSDDSAIYTANEGTPTGSVAAGRAWTLDATGNWTAYKQDNNGDGYYTGAGDLDQSRLHNKANEIQAISGTNANWVDPVYDQAGNMTAGPQPRYEAVDANTQLYKYDAWNRLTKIYRDANCNDLIDDPGELVATYSYDPASPGATQGCAGYRFFPTPVRPPGRIPSGRPAGPTA